MKITADTNVLLRAIVKDDEAQARKAESILAEATIVAVPIAALCEYAWVLSRGYGFGPADLAKTIRDLAESATIRLDRAAVQAGLAHLDAGGDFADGVIAFDGQRFGGDVFVSFDRKATRLVERSGLPVKSLGGR